MANAFWYIIFMLISITVTFYTIYKNKNASNLILFYFLSAGLAFLCEYLVLMIFNGYKYIPKLVEPPYADNVVGHIISNAVILPTVAVLALGYKLRWKGILALSLVMSLIDWFFVKLNIYIHYWWRSYMTFFTVLIYLFAAVYWKQYLEKRPRTILSSITYLFIAFSILILKFFFMTILMQKVRFSMCVVDDIFYDNTLFYPLYALVLSSLYMIFICHFTKIYWSCVPLLLNIILNFALYRLDMLNFFGGWNWIHITFFDTLALFAFIVVFQSNKNKVMCKSWYGG